MNLPPVADLDDAARIVYEVMPPTPQFRWPQLGAGAAALAAAIQERDSNAGHKVGIMLTGGNVDTEVFGAVLGGAPQ